MDLTVTRRLGGWKKDPFSDKDLPFELMRPHLVEKVAPIPHIIQELTPISDQGDLGSCVGNSTTDALEILMGVQDPKSVIQLSRLMTYWIARLLNHQQTLDEGTYIRSAFAQIAKLGVCPETVWPYVESKVLVSPPIQAYEIGDSNKITSFYRISSSGQQRLNDIETAVCSNHPVVFGTTVGSNLMNYNGGSDVLSIPTDALGGHAIICTGVRPSPTRTGKKEFFIRNSWGKAWGLLGHCWFSEEYMMWSATDDLWVPTLIPALKLAA